VACRTTPVADPGVRLGDPVTGTCRGWPRLAVVGVPAVVLLRAPTADLALCLADGGPWPGVGTAWPMGPMGLPVRVHRARQADYLKPSSLAIRYSTFAFAQDNCVAAPTGSCTKTKPPAFGAARGRAFKVPSRGFSGKFAHALSGPSDQDFSRCAAAPLHRVITK